MEGRFDPEKYVVVLGDELCMANALLDMRDRVVAAYELDGDFAVLFRRSDAEKYFRLGDGDVAVYLFSVRNGEEDRCLEIAASFKVRNGLTIRDVVEVARKIFAARHLLFARN